MSDATWPEDVGNPPPQPTRCAPPDKLWSVHLTPRELDRLTIFSAAELARRRRDRGVKLNYPECVAIISDEVLEAARDGRPYQEVVALGGQLLARDQVMEGVPEMLTVLHVEVGFPDGTRLVTIRNPIR